ncbi:IS630 family transposase, partial [bacterium]
MKSRAKNDKREVLICAQDEGRFGLINNIQKCWAPLRDRPVIQKRIKREYVYGYAVVFPKLGEIEALILPGVNIDMMNLFLEHISIEYKDYFLIMQVDRAGWHKSKKIKIPENIRLIEQPAYSPETNPVEHVWDDIREKEFSNNIFDSIDKVMDKLCAGFMRLVKNSDYLKS